MIWGLGLDITFLGRVIGGEMDRAFEIMFDCVSRLHSPESRLELRHLSSNFLRLIDKLEALVIEHILSLGISLSDWSIREFPRSK